MLPIVFIHGFPFDGSMWGAQAEYLRSPEGGGHAVFTPDLPGFGAHPQTPAPPAEEASIEGLALHVHKLIQTQCGGKAIVGGFSMGGYILLALLRDFPDDVAAAMFIDTRADPDSAEARANRLRSIQDVQSNGSQNLVSTMLPRFLGKRPSTTVKEHVRAAMATQSVAAIVAVQSAMARRRDQSGLLPQLKLPVLLVVGAEDAVTPPSVALAMQSHMPHAMLVQIAAAGHVTPLEQPDAVNSAVKSFLATLHE